MANADQPGKGQGRADESSVGKGGRPGSPGKDRGTRGTDTGSELTDVGGAGGVSGQKNKPGIGQPGRGGDDLSGHGTQRSDSRGAEAGSQSGNWQSGDVNDKNTNVGRGQLNTPGKSPGGGSNPASRQHSPSAENVTEAPESGQGRQPKSSGEETMGGNEGAY